MRRGWKRWERPSRRREGDEKGGLLPYLKGPVLGSLGLQLVPEKAQRVLLPPPRLLHHLQVVAVNVGSFLPQTQFSTEQRKWIKVYVDHSQR